MAKFIIECPVCGRYTEASTSLFAKKKIKCVCGYNILIKTDKVSSKKCENCGNTVIYDQSLGEKAVCPVCKHKINTVEDISNHVNLTCPTCGCKVNTNKNLASCICPLCETIINVPEQIAKENIKKQNAPITIKYEGSNRFFVWKYPITDFIYGSVLIVHESQQAVFLGDGIALEPFKAGRYTLDPNQLPLLQKIISRNEQMMHSEVYFINMTTHMGIKWGTDTKVRLFDPASGLHVELGAYGQLNLQVSDAKQLLLKIVGTAKELIQETNSDESKLSENLMSKFRALIMNKVKSNLAKTIKEKNINVLEIDEYLEDISNDLKDKINLALAEYGLMMPEFYVTTIITPDDDMNFKRLKQQFAEKTLRVRQENILKDEAYAAQARKIVEAQTDAQLKILAAQGDKEAMILRAQAEAEEMRLKGYTYQQETQRKVSLEATKNLGLGDSSALGDIVKLGVGLGSINTVMDLTKNTIQEAANPHPTVVSNSSSWDCSRCGQKGITSNFCGNCGAKRSDSEIWICSCGYQNKGGNFCGNCGKAK